MGQKIGNGGLKVCSKADATVTLVVSESYLLYRSSLRGWSSFIRYLFAYFSFSYTTDTAGTVATRFDDLSFFSFYDLSSEGPFFSSVR